MELSVICARRVRYKILKIALHSPNQIIKGGCCYYWKPACVCVGGRGGSYRGGGGGRLWHDYEFNFNSVGLPRNTRSKVGAALRVTD